MSHLKKLLNKKVRPQGGTFISDGGANAGFDKHTISPSHRIAVPMREDGAMSDAGHGNSGNKDEGAEHL